MDPVTRPDETSTHIAIVGMACRLPGAATVAQFWTNLRAGVESIRRLTPEELIAAGLDPDALADPHHVPFGALLPDVKGFDAHFFGIPAREAELMDPQQRLFLECAWEALEDAGCDPSRFDGAIGTFGGANFNSYLTRNLLPADVFEDKAAVLQTILSNDKDYLATRVAYRLNLRGPAFTIQSGCSTSLLAVHLASHSLLGYECDLALAGGVAIDLARAQGYWAHEGSVFSPDGRCRPFGAGAQGTVFGNGAAVVALKRLSDAINDGDTIHAVIIGSAVNNDGSLKVGFTAPSVTGQSAVVAEALADAGISADSIGYVEAHGTGTQLGDPIEIEALTKAFGRRAPGIPKCAVGSVKSNVGHLDSAAGVTGLIKTALALRHGELPPTLHASAVNPEIPFESSPFRVNSELTPWTGGTQPGVPRRAGVSSFGMGGTNVHVVLEEAPAQLVAPANRTRQLLVWSARTPEALDRVTASLREALSTTTAGLADVAYTQQTGRALFAHRRCLVADSTVEACAMLERRDAGVVSTFEFDGASRQVAFLLPGHESFRAGIGRELYESELAFREAFDQCRALMRSVTGADLARQETELAAPALFSLEYALARLWQSWGVQPAALLGHDLGEYVAACLAGVFSLEDALRVVVLRARLLPQGAGASAPSTTDAAGQSFADAFAANRIRLSEPAIPFVSNVSGTWILPEEATNPYYWAEHLRRPVRFAEGLRCLADAGPYHLLEVGPGRLLTTLAGDIARQAGVTSIASLPGAEQPAPQTMLEAAGRLWQLGAKLDWPALHGHRRRRRVPLPTYPFERAEYWIEPPDEDEEGTDSSSAAGAVQRRGDASEWLYAPGWTQTPAAELAGQIVKDPPAEQWLVFSDDSALAAEVVSRLKVMAGPDRVAVAAPGARFQEVGPQSYTIDPATDDDYLTLIAALTAKGSRPTVVVHLWAASATPDDDRDGVAVRRAQRQGAFSVVGVTRALEATGSAGRVSLRVVTRSAHDVLGTEPLSLASATLSGIVRVISQELPHVEAGCIDLEAADEVVSAAGAAFQAGRIVAEVTRAVREPFVAYRGAARWTPSYKRLQPPAGRASILRTGGTYLILGGLGRVGHALAAHLAETARARLVLVARTPLPPRETWNEWTDLHGESDPVSHRIRRVQKLEALGSAVLVVPADVAEVPELERAFALAEQRFGAVHGVVAAAGIVDGAFRAMTSFTEEEFERQFRPKIDGLFALERIVASRPIDFCLVVSSLSSVLGGLGYGAYAAANTFMDAFVRRHNRSYASPWLSANWDAWRWTDVGPGVPGGALMRLAMRPDEAAQVFDLLLPLVGAADQIVISTTDLDARLAQWVEFVRERRSEVPAAEPSGKPGAAGGPAAPDDRPLTPTQRAVVDTWARVLGLRRVELGDTFLDIGGSSLTAVQAISSLEQQLGVHVAIEEFIFQTAGQLAGLCDRRLAQTAAPEPAPPGGLLRSLRSVVIGKR